MNQPISISLTMLHISSSSTSPLAFATLLGVEARLGSSTPSRSCSSIIASTSHSSSMSRSTGASCGEPASRGCLDDSGCSRDAMSSAMSASRSQSLSSPGLITRERDPAEGCTVDGFRLLSGNGTLAVWLLSSRKISLVAESSSLTGEESRDGITGLGAISSFH